MLKKDSEHGIPTETILIFLALWVLFTFITYGVWVPAGLFLPGIIIGSCLGLLWLQGMIAMGYSVWTLGGQSYVIMGASAMLTSYCRMTYSLAVIMLETTQSVNLFLPIILTVAVSLFVSKQFNRGLYDYAIRGKQLPFLREKIPVHARHLHAWEIMTKDPVIVEGIASVSRIAEIIKDDKYNMFPVLNMAGNIFGLIPKNFLVILVEHHNWYRAPEGKDVTELYATHKKADPGSSQVSEANPESDQKLLDSQAKGGSRHKSLNVHSKHHFHNDDSDMKDETERESNDNNHGRGPKTPGLNNLGGLEKKSKFEN